MPSFEELGVCEELLRSIAEQDGWDLPTDVQDECIPLILGGGDVMVAAETGSGKTGAFALPILQAVFEDSLKQAAVMVPDSFDPVPCMVPDSFDPMGKLQITVDGLR